MAGERHALARPIGFVWFLQ